MSRLIIVANRAPVTLSSDTPGQIKGPSPGGLVAALDPVWRARGALWVGWPGTDAEAGTHGVGLGGGGPTYAAGCECRFVIPPHDVLEGHYNGFSNSVLWPHLHSMPSRAYRSRKNWLDAYRAANHMFAGEVLRVARADDLVWVHDYQLMLVPRLMRDAGFAGRIGFFLHTPFPPYHAAKEIPAIRELLDSVLAADLVGVQVPEWQRHLLEAAVVLMGAEAVGPDTVRHSHRVTAILALPIGIDHEGLLKKKPRPRREEWRPWLDSPARLLGVERLDYTKAIPCRFRALERFFRLYPKRRGNVTLLQCLQTSRSTIAAYRRERSRVVAAADRLNRSFGTPKWAPVLFAWEASHDVVVDAYSEAGVLIVSPLCDGMPLVAKEFAVAGPPDGVLVLSKYAGAAYQLGQWSVAIDPTDPLQSAEAIREALDMPPAERRSRMDALRRSVRANDVFWWADRNLEILRNGH